ncbi:MAG TPA: hypothetical protein PKH54_12745, partial [Myxococcota bacterium]|nr:hypothetical protein [Myxococcota bacterium]
SCEAVTCDDCNPLTTNDRCMQNAAMTCECGGDPIMDVCDFGLNPECNPDPCDDGSVLTMDDKCVTFGDICLCMGSAIEDPCSSVLNPECVDKKCDD